MTIGNRSPFIAASATRLVLYVLVASLLLSGASFGQARTVKQSNITAAELDTLLKNNPAITTGFKTPGGVTVQLAKRIPGGLVLRYESPGNAGNATFVGPKTIMDKTFWEQVISLGIELTKKITGGKDTGDCEIEIKGKGGTVSGTFSCTAS